MKMPSSSQIVRTNCSGVNCGIEDHRDVGMTRHALEQRAHDRGLAGADFAGELNEAAGLVDAVQQVRERLRMPLAHEEVARIGSDRERLFAQAEKARVHAELLRVPSWGRMMPLAERPGKRGAGRRWPLHRRLQAIAGARSLSRSITSLVTQAALPAPGRGPIRLRPPF